VETIVMKDQVVLVTGGARGIGRAVSEAFVANGATVIATSRRGPKGALHESAHGLVETHLDVVDESSIDSLFAAIEHTYGRLDVLVNNAGVGVFKPITELSLDEWQLTLATNLTGAFLCARAAFSVMKQRGGGRIIHIGSVADTHPLPTGAAYGASKFGLRGLHLVLNEEGKAFGVRSSLVSPGAVATDIWNGRPGFEPSDMLRPEDVAASVLDIARRPLSVRIDEVRLMPPKGIL
jgi:NAD(P)-dependent dehydrogenase (short-subunit alcohol dehydrogenase family)